MLEECRSPSCISVLVSGLLSFERRGLFLAAFCLPISADLYHFDHFLHFKTACAALVDCQSYSVLPGIPEQLLTASQQQQKQHSAGISQSSASHGPHLPGSEEFYVSVTDSKGSDGGVFKFVLVQQDFGLKQGCWMTKSCFKVL